MKYKVLSLKWRPMKFDQVIGQDHITQALSNAIKLNRVAHAFTFSGPRGVGKTSTARILAKTINNISDLSESIDVIEMDAASNRGIDEIRNLNESVNYAPAHGKYKIYIIDEVHMLTKEAFNALLKTLEEPPAYVIFILATTELHKMPETIVSRTQRYEFKRLTIEDIKNQLIVILDDEKIKYDNDSLILIAQKADGSMRDALSILDQMICYTNNDLILEKVQKALGIVTEDQYHDLLSFVGERKIDSILAIVNRILNDGISINQFIEGFNQFLRDAILFKAKNKDDSNEEFSKILFDDLDLLRILDMCLKFQISIKNFKQPKIVLETLIIKLAYLDSSIDIARFIHHNQDKVSGDLNSDGRINSKKNIKELIEKKSNKENVNNDYVDKEVKEHSAAIKVSKNKIDQLVNKSNNKNINISNVEFKDSNKISSISEKNNELENKKELSVTLDDVKNNWPKILDVINNRNSKIAVFLEQIVFEKLEDGKLFILVKEVNDFSIKALENDRKFIEGIISQVLDVALFLVLNYENSSKNDEANKSDSKIKSDEDHPLFMDALNKFDGKLIN